MPWAVVCGCLLGVSCCPVLAGCLCLLVYFLWVSWCVLADLWVSLVVGSSVVVLWLYDHLASNICWADAICDYFPDIWRGCMMYVILAIYDIYVYDVYGPPGVPNSGCAVILSYDTYMYMMHIFLWVCYVWGVLDDPYGLSALWPSVFALLFELYPIAGCMMTRWFCSLIMFVSLWLSVLILLARLVY